MKFLEVASLKYCYQSSKIEMTFYESRLKFPEVSKIPSLESVHDAMGLSYLFQRPISKPWSCVEYAYLDPDVIHHWHY